MKIFYEILQRKDCIASCDLLEGLMELPSLTLSGSKPYAKRINETIEKHLQLPVYEKFELEKRGENGEWISYKSIYRHFNKENPEPPNNQSIRAYLVFLKVHPGEIETFLAKGKKRPQLRNCIDYLQGGYEIYAPVNSGGHTVKRSVFWMSKTSKDELEVTCKGFNNALLKGTAKVRNNILQCVLENKSCGEEIAFTIALPDRTEPDGYWLLRAFGTHIRFSELDNINWILYKTPSNPEKGRWLKKRIKPIHYWNDITFAPHGKSINAAGRNEIIRYLCIPKTKCIAGVTWDRFVDLKCYNSSNSPPWLEAKYQRVKTLFDRDSDHFITSFSMDEKDHQMVYCQKWEAEWDDFSRTCTVKYTKNETGITFSGIVEIGKVGQMWIKFFDELQIIRSIFTTTTATTRLMHSPILGKRLYYGLIENKEVQSEILAITSHDKIPANGRISRNTFLELVQLNDRDKEYILQ